MTWFEWDFMVDCSGVWYVVDYVLYASAIVWPLDLACVYYIFYDCMDLPLIHTGYVLDFRINLSKY